MTHTGTDAGGARTDGGALRVGGEVGGRVADGRRRRHGPAAVVVLVASEPRGRGWACACGVLFPSVYWYVSWHAGAPGARRTRPQRARACILVTKLNPQNRKLTYLICGRGSGGGRVVVNVTPCGPAYLLCNSTALRGRTCHKWSRAL